MMKKFIVSLLMSTVLLSLVSCSSDLSEESITGSIVGSISDATTGEPVSNVNIKLSPGGNATVTGSDGSFSFNNLKAEEYTISISKEGYKQNSTNLIVRSGDPTYAHLLIERIPGIVTADRETLDFGANQSLNTLSFNIVNASYEDLEWEIEERCDWITEIKPQKGILAYGKTEGIVVVIDRSLLSSGENNAVIVIRSSQGSSQMNVVATANSSLPKLNVLGVTNITSSAATFNGEIIDPGEPEYSERGFVYSTNPSPTIENCVAKLSCPVNSNKNFSYNISGLALNQKYYVRTYAVNTAGVGYSSNETSFNTITTAPEVKTVGIFNTNFSKGTATFRGEIINTGLPAYSERGFVYSTMESPTIYDHKIKVEGEGVLGAFSMYTSNLPKSKYYVRAYATNAYGTVYGEQVEAQPDWFEIPSAGIAVQLRDLGQMDWESANSACRNSRVGGFSDWRLPSKSELSILYTYRNEIGGFYSARYWSGTFSERYNGISYYYCLYFLNSYSYSEDYSENALLNVRAVRTLK